MNYTSLLASLASWNNRSDLTARYPEFIELAEAHFGRILRCPQMEAEATQSVAVPEVALPSDFLALREVRIGETVLNAMSPSSIRSMYGDRSGVTQAYAIAGNRIVLAPVPTSPVTVEINYFAKVPALSASNPSNWLIAAYPDLYLRAVRYYSFEALRNVEAADRELAMVGALLDSINQAGHSARLPAAPLAMRPAVFE
jgi:hypothetical protein